MTKWLYVRGARPAELPAIRSNVDLAFGQFPNDRDGTWIDDWFERIGMVNFRTLWEGDRDRLAASLHVVPMGHYFGGRSVPCAGVAAVAVPPESRGRGAGKRLMGELIRELASNQVALSSLYPAILPVYRAAGYELAGGIWDIEVPLTALRSVSSSRDVEPLGPRGASPSAEVRECYARFAASRPGRLDRGSYIWDRVNAPRAATATGFGVRDDGGVLRGYMYLMKVPGKGPRADVVLSDLVSEDGPSARALLATLGGMASTGDLARWAGGPQETVLMHLRDPSYKVTLRDYWMLRLADVRAAFGQRGYPEHLRGTLELDLDDELVASNSGRFVLEVADGRGELTPGGGGALRMHVRTAASLYSGFLPASHALAQGLVCGSADAARFADQLFAGPAPCMSDHF